jgi:hypothetical protein
MTDSAISSKSSLEEVANKAADAKVAAKQQRDKTTEHEKQLVAARDENEVSRRRPPATI